MGGVSDEVLLARAYLSRVAEPTELAVWQAVLERGPVAVAQDIRRRVGSPALLEATAARAASADAYADLEAAARHGIRLLVPESDEWPHYALSALEAAGLRRLAARQQESTPAGRRGELVPPLALWVRGVLDPAPIGVRSAAVVGSRAASPYGEHVAKELGYQLADRDVVIVSGGAYGIDAAAHRGALAARGATVLVSAGGLDAAYPRVHSALFEQVAESGLLVSESPPGSAPQRHRFLSRNRLIAAFGTGTVVVEAAWRSGATNTANYAADLGRTLMAVPGSVTSGTSAGCHVLIKREHRPARLVTDYQDVLALIGSASELSAADDGGAAAPDSVLDTLDAICRRVYDGFPARGWVGPDRLSVSSGLSATAVIRSLPLLEVAGLIEGTADRYRRVRRSRAGVAP